MKPNVPEKIPNKAPLQRLKTQTIENIEKQVLAQSREFFNFPVQQIFSYILFFFIILHPLYIANVYKHE